MIVKIGNKFTDSKDEPIMIILDNEEKALISEMGKQTKFVCFPEDLMDADKREAFMKDEVQVTDSYFKDKTPISTIEHNFTKDLLSNTLISYYEIIDLIEFFNDKGHLEDAVGVYEKYGITGLLIYKAKLV